MRARALGAPGARAPRDPVHAPRAAARARPAPAAPPAPGERRRGPAGAEGRGGAGRQYGAGRARRAVPRGGDDGGLVWPAGRGRHGEQWPTAGEGLPGQSVRLWGLRSAVAPSLELGSCLQTLPRKEGGWGPVVLSRGAMGRREARPWILQPEPGEAEPRPAGQRVQQPHPGSSDKARLPHGQRPGPPRTHTWHLLCLAASRQGGRGPGSTDAPPGAPQESPPARSFPLWQVPAPCGGRHPAHAPRSAWSAGGRGLGEEGQAQRSGGQPRPEPAPLGSTGRKAGAGPFGGAVHACRRQAGVSGTLSGSAWASGPSLAGISHLNRV